MLSVGIVAFSALAWFGLGQISGAITKIDVFGKLTKRPDKPTSAVNYLVVGSDTRQGLSKAELKLLRVGSVKSAAGARSDTMMLVHISKNRDNAAIISLPRDTLVTVPEHIGPLGKMVPAQAAKLNAAFAWGGAPLLIQTLETKMNLRIDHYVEVNFAGFKNVVDALGGIQVCTKRDINDKNSHLVLPAGIHTLDGIESLKYVRARDFDGLGDIGRMQRQQQFVSAVFKKATSTGILINPIKIAETLGAVLKTVKTDSQLNQSDLLTLAKQMKNLTPGKMRTLTIPLQTSNGYDPVLGSVVIWDPVLAPDLFNRLKNDLPIVDTVVATPSPKNSKSPTPTPSATTIDKFKTRTASENPCGAIK